MPGAPRPQLKQAPWLPQYIITAVITFGVTHTECFGVIAIGLARGVAITVAQRKPRVARIRFQRRGKVHSCPIVQGTVNPKLRGREDLEVVDFSVLRKQRNQLNILKGRCHGCGYNDEAIAAQNKG